MSSRDSPNFQTEILAGKQTALFVLRCLWWQRWMVRVFGSSTDYVDPSEHLFPPSPSARYPWWPSILSHAARLTRPWGGVGERLCCLWKSISSLFDSSSNPIDNCCRFFPPDLLRYDWQINIDMYFRCTIWRFGIHIHCSMMITIKLINTFIISHSYLCVCICVWWENLIFILLLLFRRSVMSDSLWSHGLQHTRPPYPSPSPGACPNSCALSWWCHPTISSSAIHFSSHLQSFPSSGSFSSESVLCIRWPKYWSFSFPSHYISRTFSYYNQKFTNTLWPALPCSPPLWLWWPPFHLLLLWVWLS